MKRTTCRSCGSSALEQVIDLGNQPPSNALLKSPDQVAKTYPLVMVVCTACWLMQTETDVPHEELFSADYPYYSGGSAEWRAHCAKYAAYATKRFNLTPSSYVIEIGGNDGTLLQNFNCDTLNVEPSVNVARVAMSRNIPTLVDRVQNVTARRGGADLIVANNVLAHDPDLNGFVEAIARNLAPHGTCTTEFPWAVNMLEDCEFDTIYHEHYSYFSITALAPLLARHGLIVYDAEELGTHGGSLRVYVRHGKQVAIDLPVASLRFKELAGIHEQYRRFSDRAFNCAGDFVKFLQHHPGEVLGLGAAAKATVFTNFAGINASDIAMIGDSTPAKWGKFIPGSRIPIVPEADVLAAAPPYLWIPAWNWKREIAEKCRAAGYKGKFVTAIPILEIFE